MDAQLTTVERLAKQINDIFENNPEAKQKFPLLKEKLIHFAQNHSKENVECFVEAWGQYNARSVAKILNHSYRFVYVQEKDINEFFNFLLRKLS